MPAVIAVTVERQVWELTQHYVQIFKDRFGEAPSAPEFEDTACLRHLIETYKLEKAKKYLSGYLALPSDYLKENGYPLRQIKRSLNAIIVNESRDHKVARHYYVVAISESGVPVLSLKEDEMPKGYLFKPVSFDEWVKSPLDKKIGGLDFKEEWVNLWHEMGYAL